LFHIPIKGLRFIKKYLSGAHKQSRSSLISLFLFWIFLIATILHIVFLLFIPTPTEWPGQFPYDFKRGWEFWAPFLRHLSLFREHFPIAGFIDLINGAFLTMFIYKMGLDLEAAIKSGDGNGDGKLAPSTYVDWAMGALFSGIIFASSRIAQADLSRATTYVVAIFVFSFVAYYFMYRLRRKLRIEEGKPVTKSDSET